MQTCIYIYTNILMYIKMRVAKYYEYYPVESGGSNLPLIY